MMNNLQIQKSSVKNTQKDVQMADTYVKFYKYEEVKQRHSM